MVEVQNGTIQGDHQVVTPRDSISSVKFGGRRDLVAATSWDNSASVFQYTRDQNKLSSQLLLQSQDHTLPVLSCCFSPDGDKLATASLDKTGRIWDLERNASNVLAQHEQGIKCINWVDSRALVVTGSWDRTLKYWPTNMNGAMATVGVNERVYAMDVVGDTCVVACADRNIHVFDMRNFTIPVTTHQSPLRHQIRTVALFPNQQGYAIGSIEGRVHIQHLNEGEGGGKKDFAFKCHRDSATQDIYAVNAICFHKKHGTFCTAGSDGTFNFWDKEAKQRLKGFPRLPNAISACDFNDSGDIFAYAVSYDWARGSEGQNKTAEALWLHPVSDHEIRPKRV